MASLQDQLLKAGLVDGKKAKQISKEKRKQNKVAKKSGDVQVDEAKLAAEQARAEKVARDRELNAQREAAAQQKAIAAQIKQLIERNKQPKGASGQNDIAYHFTFDKKVKKLYVSAAVQDHLIAGRLLIVGEGEHFELVPRVIADKIAERNPAMVVQPPAQSAPVEEDDPYAGYEIPDDLMW
ncbi:DUF2058 domain-containing protein [Microbulbifer harenosus]|uniref:DUF2058 domain-containing protein n=1 Tax=Microbulbifer harenosus TaxID=2576840 RepID=A0ABY2UKB5_9GAMM|nr:MULTISPECIES: DUF2058 domain-containing protein [Microbulbifer]QIL89398.1 DUF2058 family protein [Microbulbifer sp. SH-1]TLM78698.1 DUF2058 domain-containing protein [Microbulbifer harenosus]